MIGGAHFILRAEVTLWKPGNMRTTASVIVGCLIIGAGAPNPATAHIVGVIGPASTLGALPFIIQAPSDVLNHCVTFDGQVAFDEAQGVITPAAFTADNGVVIPAGTLVDSHMIFFNQQSSIAVSTHSDVEWTFKRPIIAVMSNASGTLESASSYALGAPGTNYLVPATVNCVPFGPTGAAPFANRGLDTATDAPPYTHISCPAPDDCYTVKPPTSILVKMTIGQPGDWMRVITEGAFDVRIDVKPGSDPNCFNINGAGVVPVAILGSATFDATQIDTSTLDFAGLAVRVKGNGTPQCGISDTNNDGFSDLVCQFQDDSNAWSPGTTTATLTGRLLNEMAFEGSDAICVVP
jgi:hypothetical protein